MNITLKPDTEKLVRERLQSGEFKDASDFVDEAIRYMLENDKAEAAVETLVQEGIDSGPATEMTREDFEAIRRDVHAKHRKGE